ncbi:MAG TPA: tetratricopeptide repeat protein [Polyangiales bacterium]|nr:tetratricopeptide repeat protein [Polyangiales bacterium]
MIASLRAAVCLLALGCAGTVVQSAPQADAARPPVAARHVGSPYAYEWFMRAEILRAKNQLEPALEAYRLALSSADEDPYVLARYAGALDLAGQTGRAQDVLRDAFAQDPQAEAAWLVRAQIAERSGQLSAALEAYERAEASAPSSPGAPLALAALLDRQGQPERARAVLARYEARSLPGTTGAQRARLREAVLRKDARAAYVEARGLRTLLGADVAMLARAAELLLAERHCSLALELLAPLERRHEHAELRLRALLACAQLGAAEQLLRETDPELLGGTLAVARAYLRIGRAAEALEIASAYRLAHPDDRAATLLVAQAELARGAYVEAAEAFSRVPAAASGGSEAREGLVRALEAAGASELASEVAQYELAREVAQ